MPRMSRAARRYLEVRLEAAAVRRGEREILHAVNWRIRPGEHWVLAGANGAGKTQLLKLLAGLVWPVPAARPVLQYRLGRQAGATPFGFKDAIAYLGAERQDKYQRYGWDVSAARIVGTGLYHSDIALDALSPNAVARFKNSRRLMVMINPFLSVDGPCDAAVRQKRAQKTKGTKKV